ncbi:hypothetical protein CFC21_027333 [Triticum aestivum]|nr:hypothetical protein CFC21_027333 [Triticum aestivum]
MNNYGSRLSADFHSRAMSSELPPPPPPAPAKPPSIPSAATTTTTTLATAADGTTTISSLGQDQLLEIFLRLPNLPALVRAALTCRSWLGAVRSSRRFRRLFRALHPAPLLGIFLEVDVSTSPSFAPLRRSDPDVSAALRRGDFFLTSLPPDDGAPPCWTVTDCRDGYILMWNSLWAVAAVNPMTWAADIISLPAMSRSGASPVSSSLASICCVPRRAPGRSAWSASAPTCLGFARRRLLVGDEGLGRPPMGGNRR